MLQSLAPRNSYYFRDELAKKALASVLGFLCFLLCRCCRACLSQGSAESRAGLRGGNAPNDSEGGVALKQKALVKTSLAAADSAAAAGAGGAAGNSSGAAAADGGDGFIRHGISDTAQ